MTKESVYITKKLNSHRIGLVCQHDKRKCLHKKRVELPQDWSSAPTWPPFGCFGTPIGSLSNHDGDARDDAWSKINYILPRKFVIVIV